jgi:hypothetical protein
MKTYTKFISALVLTILIVSCGKESTTPKTVVNLKGKIAPSLSMGKDGIIEFYDLRDANNPKKAAFNIVGTTADNIQLQYVKSRPIGSKTIKANYGDLNNYSNNETYLADRNWPNWTNISVVGNWLVMNNDSTNQLYPAYQETEGISKIYTYTSTFNKFSGLGNWATTGTINGCVEVYESYNKTYYNAINNTRNAFFFNFRTQEYLFDYDINDAGRHYTGYKITDLVKKPNGNMDTDPIDWTKADFAFDISYGPGYTGIKYNGKKVTVFVFVDLDTKTYAAFVRNTEDDAINGADKARQTLLTTSWQPLSNLFKGWDL